MGFVVLKDIYMNEICLNLELIDFGIEVWYVYFVYIIVDIVLFR